MAVLREALLPTLGRYARDSTSSTAPDEPAGPPRGGQPGFRARAAFRAVPEAADGRGEQQVVDDLAQAVAASLHGRVALGPRAGQPVRRLRSAADALTTGRRTARLEGFSLHADVAVPARRRDQLERLCRDLLRPPVAPERLTESTGGQLLYQFPRAWSDGSTALLLEPLELLERLAALVPPPRRPLLADHGLLAPHAEWRAAVVPKPSRDAARGAAGAPAPRRWPWARVLHRVFVIDVLVCDRCGGPRRLLGAVTEPAAVRRVLVALRLAAEAPPGDARPAA